MILEPMNATDPNYIPIYLKLFEREGKPLEQLVNDVKVLTKETSLEDDVLLVQITRSEKNSSLYALVYCVQTKPLRQRHSMNVGEFLDKIFSQFTDKHPAYSEPVNLESGRLS